MSAIEDLRSLDSAEAFFQDLGASYDPEVLGFARLHVLKRMGDSLAKLDLAGLTDEDVRAAARKSLDDAYRDVTQTGPLGRRVFKVLKDHDPARPAKARGKSFVGLDEIRAAR